MGAKINKNVLKHTGVPIFLTLTVIAICFYINRVDVALLALLTGSAWIALTLGRLSDRRYLYNIQTSTKLTQKNTSKSLSTINKIENDVNKIDETTSRSDRRSLQSSIVINNIAGTTGRSAPIIRDIQKTVRNLSNQSSIITNTDESEATDQNRNLDQKIHTDVKRYEFQPITVTTARPTFPHIKVAVIADEFTARAFAYEWHTFEPTPENWKVLLEEQKPDFLFVESAWEANGGTWRYHLVGQSAPRQAVIDLVSYCKQNNITTVFWNKEDPPHFEEFLPTAKLFDYVFTSDGNLISKYKERLKHERVDVLAFAAQPKIHNPARVHRVKRDRDIVFGGMYFREKYPERREQLDMILPAASKFDLDIYSRNTGEDIRYRFPDEYITAVRGSLPYAQMLTAYHAYKTVINVNSVVDSKTMCARRIFEATACGAAVVTGSTAAIRNFFPDQMLTEVSSQEDAYHKIRALLRSDEYRDRLVHKAQRHIWANHTYTQRAIQVMRAIGLSGEIPNRKRSFFVSTNRPSNVDYIFQNFARQTVSDKELVVLTHGFEIDKKRLKELQTHYGVDELTVLSAPASNTLGSNLNTLTQACTGDVLFRMDDDDYYGANYALDLENALDFSGAALVGKAATYIYFENQNCSVLTYGAHENRYTDFVRGATFCGWKSTFDRFKFPELERSEDSSFLNQLKSAGERVYAADRFNLLVMRRADKSTHTWTVNDEQLFASGEMKFIGSDPQQIEV